MHKWNDDLTLFTIAEFNNLPDGIELVSINGRHVIKGQDHIDMNTIVGYLGYGVEDPLSEHCESELFTKLRLML